MLYFWCIYGVCDLWDDSYRCNVYGGQQPWLNGFKPPWCLYRHVLKNVSANAVLWSVKGKYWSGGECLDMNMPFYPCNDSLYKATSWSPDIYDWNCSTFKWQMSWLWTWEFIISERLGNVHHKGIVHCIPSLLIDQHEETTFCPPCKSLGLGTSILEIWYSFNIYVYAIVGNVILLSM